MNQATKDTRIVYANGCTWWDSIDKVSTVGPLKIPCCPHCKSVLFEVPSLEIWNEGVDSYTRSADPNYRKFMDWLRGKCFKDHETAREKFNSENQ